MAAEEVKKPPNEHVVTALREMLTKASTGELQGFVLIGTTNEDIVYTVAEGRMKVYETLGNMVASTHIVAALRDAQLEEVIHNIAWE